MTTKTQNKFRRLKLLYLFILILTFFLVAPPHLFPPPYFMPLRFPHYLETMGPFFGVSWPMSFEIYHYALYALVVIASLNALGILLYPKLKHAALLSSLFGIFLIPPMILFFFFVFINVNGLTAIIYGQYCVILLIADILTFKALIIKPQASLTRQKEASRG